MATLPPHTFIKMPSLSPVSASRWCYCSAVLAMESAAQTMETGVIAEWIAVEGEKFDAGDPLAEMQTDKARVSFDATDEGVLAKILKPTGSENVPVNAVIAVAVESLDDVKAFANFTEDDIPAELRIGDKPASPPTATPEPVAAAQPQPVAAAQPQPVAPPTTSVAANAPIQSTNGYVAFERWGRSIEKSSAYKDIQQGQDAYVAAFGPTMMEMPK
jgi:pyruvate dehydrogenase E2 component (dihydrolipoamide acetyltransferase)